MDGEEHLKLKWDIRVLEMDIIDTEKAILVRWDSSIKGAKRIPSCYTSSKYGDVYRDTPDAHKRPVQGRKVSPK